MVLTLCCVLLSFVVWLLWNVFRMLCNSIFMCGCFIIIGSILHRELQILDGVLCYFRSSCISRGLFYAAAAVPMAEVCEGFFRFEMQ